MHFSKTLIKRYFQNRRQYGTYNNQNSTIKHIKCGVSQGSILAPLLFKLSANDLSIIVSILFANDTDSFIHGNDLNKLIGELQAELTTKAIKLLNLF